MPESQNLEGGGRSSRRLRSFSAMWHVLGQCGLHGTPSQNKRQNQACNKDIKNTKLSVNQMVWISGCAKATSAGGQNRPCNSADLALLLFRKEFGPKALRVLLLIHCPGPCSIFCVLMFWFCYFSCKTIKMDFRRQNVGIHAS